MKPVAASAVPDPQATDVPYAFRIHTDFSRRCRAGLYCLKCAKPRVSYAGSTVVGARWIPHFGARSQIPKGTLIRSRLSLLPHHHSPQDCFLP